MNGKGQMMIVGILILVITVIIFVAMLPAMQSVTDIARGCSYFNCAGYVDPNSAVGDSCISTNQTYTSSLEEKSLSCTAIDIMIPILILIVIAGLAAALIKGKLATESQPTYPGY